MNPAAIFPTDQSQHLSHLLAVNMIDRNIIPLVFELHSKENLSLRQIAKRLGISRGTVTSILKHEHTLQREKKKGGETDKFQAPGGNFFRCQKCGRQVRMPCLACYLEEMRKNRKSAGTKEKEDYTINI